MQILWTSCITKLHFTWHSCYSQMACLFPLAEFPHTHHKYFYYCMRLEVFMAVNTWTVVNLAVTPCDLVKWLPTCWRNTAITWLQSSATQDHNSPHYRLSNSCFKEIRLHFNYPCHHPNPVKKFPQMSQLTYHSSIKG